MAQEEIGAPEVLTGETRFNAGTRTTAHEVEVQPTNRYASVHRTWFRGEHTNRSPHWSALYDLAGIEEYVLHGMVPETPLIDEKTQITAFGSCFASHISNHLAAQNFAVAGREGDDNAAYVIRCGEGMVNTFVIRQQFEWAWENKTFDGELWHGYKAESYGYDEKVRLATKTIFDRTEVFILTLGLSEVWYDEVTGNVFWRTIPKDVYDPSRHKFRMSSVDENRENIEAILALIKKYRPDAQVILTLSPVPLVATFRDQACMSSNEVSKAVLRLALDEVMQAGHSGVWYWPSYEIVRRMFDGCMNDDMRHPNKHVISFIMTLFETAWCTGRAGKVELMTHLGNALVASHKLPAPLGRAFAAKDRRLVEEFLGRAQIRTDPKTDAASKKLLRAILNEWDAQVV